MVIESDAGDTVDLCSNTGRTNSRNSETCRINVGVEDGRVRRQCVRKSGFRA